MALFFKEEDLYIEDRVSGPIVVTYSEHDVVLNRIYPVAAGLAGQDSFAPGELPLYGAAGAFGLRGPGLDIVDEPMRPTGEDYSFPGGQIVNLDAGQYIKKGFGLLGAHRSITEPEVAHAAWQAMKPIES